jgi:hypothetical protein
MSSSHRARRRAADPRAAGRRRITGATAVSAAGGAALAVFFGSLFAQAFADASTPTKAAPVEAATAALSDQKAVAPAAESRHALSSAPAAGEPHAGTPTTAHAAPQPPAAAPQSTDGDPAGSSGGS